MRLPMRGGDVYAIISRPRRNTSQLTSNIFLMDAALVRLGSIDRSLDIVFLFSRRKLRGKAQRLEPQLATPSLGVIQMFIFLVFNLLVGLVESVRLLGRQFLGALADDFPVEVIFGFGEYYA